MSIITINGCDGCLKPETKRKPVGIVTVVNGDTGEDVFSVDVHDNDCLRRYLSRINKTAKAAAKAERDAKTATEAGKKTK